MNDTPLVQRLDEPMEQLLADVKASEASRPNWDDSWTCPACGEVGGVDTDDLTDGETRWEICDCGQELEIRVHLTLRLSVMLSAAEAEDEP